MNQHQPSSWGQDTLRLLSRREFPLCAFTGLLPPDLRYGRLRVSPSIQGCPSPRTLTLSQMESLGIRQIGLPPLVTSEDPWSQWPPKKPENRGVGRDPLGSKETGAGLQFFLLWWSPPPTQKRFEGVLNLGRLWTKRSTRYRQQQNKWTLSRLLRKFDLFEETLVGLCCWCFPKSLYIRLPSPIPTCNFRDIFTTKSKNTFAVASF